MNPSTTPLIAVCLCTYLRPKFLTEALLSLCALRAPDGFRLHLVVVDNDFAGSARDTVDSFRQRLPFPLTYELETRRGIPFAKNRAIGTAVELGADKLAFFDDDAEVTPDWLEQFMKTDADVVEGVVHFKLPEKKHVSPLIRYYFQQMKVKKLRTGDRRQSATTTNVFFDAKLVRDWGLRFAECFAVTGGEDVHFFSKAAKHGAIICYSHLACITEKVPETRACNYWLLRRWFRLGTSATQQYRLNYSSQVATAKIITKSVSRILVNLPLLLFLPLLPIATQAKIVHRFVFGLGLFSGLFGYQYKEYKKIHGY